MLSRNTELGLLIESVQQKPVDAHGARGEVIVQVVITDMGHVSGWCAASPQRLMEDGRAWLGYTRFL